MESLDKKIEKLIEENEMLYLENDRLKNRESLSKKLDKQFAKNEQGHYMDYDVLKNEYEILKEENKHLKEVLGEFNDYMDRYNSGWFE